MILKNEVHHIELPDNEPFGYSCTSCGEFQFHKTLHGSCKNCGKPSLIRVDF